VQGQGQELVPNQQEGGTGSGARSFVQGGGGVEGGGDEEEKGGEKSGSGGGPSVEERRHQQRTQQHEQKQQHEAVVADARAADETQIEDPLLLPGVCECEELCCVSVPSLSII